MHWPPTHVSANHSPPYLSRSPSHTPQDPTTKRLNRKKKDPNAPAKGLSAYLYFCMDHRKKTQDKNPAMSLKEVASLLADQWNDATDKERKVGYHALSVSTACCASGLGVRCGVWGAGCGVWGRSLSLRCRGFICSARLFARRASSPLYHSLPFSIYPLGVKHVSPR